ncbi:MAG: hypothetical protein ACRC1K_20490 [Planctomycetia bacterium]
MSDNEHSSKEKSRRRGEDRRRLLQAGGTLAATNAVGCGGGKQEIVATVLATRLTAESLRMVEVVYPLPVEMVYRIRFIDAIEQFILRPFRLAKVDPNPARWEEFGSIFLHYDQKPTEEVWLFQPLGNARFGDIYYKIDLGELWKRFDLLHSRFANARRIPFGDAVDESP